VAHVKSLFASTIISTIRVFVFSPLRSVVAVTYAGLMPNFPSLPHPAGIKWKVNLSKLS